MTALRIRRNFQLRAILYCSRGQLIFYSDDCLCKSAPRKSRAPMSTLQVYSHHTSSFVLFPKAIISLSSVLCSIIPLHFNITDSKIQHNRIYVLYLSSTPNEYRPRISIRGPYSHLYCKILRGSQLRRAFRLPFTEAVQRGEQHKSDQRIHHIRRNG